MTIANTLAASHPKTSINGHADEDASVALRLDLMETRLDERFEQTERRFDVLENSMVRLGRSLQIMVAGQCATVLAIAATIFWH